MVPILDLWMPILVSAVLVFAVSSVLHMVFKYHNKEYRPLPREAETLAALRAAGLEPGLYHFPHCASMKEMGTPEMLEKMKQGPVGLMTVLPSGPPRMGGYLVKWFLYCVLVGVFVAYIVGHMFGPGMPYRPVFRFAGAVAFMGYALTSLVGSIWKGQPWSATLKETFDGLLYALTTAGAFGWLWPD